jgi:hypothetical protein
MLSLVAAAFAGAIGYVGLCVNLTRPAKSNADSKP